ncbi:LysR family transcriptional regulator [Arthrobacter sp. CAN_A1]|uniref:LysR family transcriptional regulator n=1 Tax=Arthrobacter sp. CAN_A1 TaxID=2787717 RepID=UPI0018C9EBB5
MTTSAPRTCKNAEVSTLNPDDLLILLAVSHTGRFTSAAESLNLNHTTVSRRITALEKSLGGHVLVRASGGWELTQLGGRAVAAAERVATALAILAGNDDDGSPVAGVVRMSATDGFSAYIAAPAFARLRRRHPRLTIEIVAATRRASQTRSGLDLEVVVGEPQVHRAEAMRLGEYMLGLYASRDYLAETPAPLSVDEASEHPLVYFIDSMLQVDSLDAPRRLLPTMKDSLSSTNVFVHVEATRAGAGLGLLPCFMADRHEDLVRLLPEAIAERLAYWLVARPDSLRQPAVAAVVAALREATTAYEDDLLGKRISRRRQAPG